MYHNFFGGTTYNRYLSSCKISSSVVLAVQLFNKIKEKNKKLRNCFTVFPICYIPVQFFIYYNIKIHLFLVILKMFLTLMSVNTSKTKS